MIPDKFSKEQTERLETINTMFEDAHNAKEYSMAQKQSADEFWDYLVTCEKVYTDGNLETTSNSHDMENILGLYYLNKLIDHGLLTAHLRETFSLPATQLTESKITSDANLAGWIAGDGTIYAASKYCQLDYEWVLVLAYYYYYKLFPNKRHPFVPSAMKVLHKDIPLNATIVIIGDWGTGSWKDGGKEKCPAQLVIDGVIAKNPDYIIHLGDVYYAGTSKEETHNFLSMIPETYQGKVFTMNSNHEMYDGANGLMGTTLKTDRFAHQGGSTYFSLEIGNWILVGLDSAYYDDSKLYFKGSLTKDGKGQEQLDFLSDAHKTGKQVMLMTHHNGLDVTKNGPTQNTQLWNQVVTAMDNKLPQAWYWGHVHNGIVYNENLALFNGQTSKMRCCGHASIPFGNAPDLKDIVQGSNPDVLYYAHTPMPNPTDEVQKLRVLNGFAMIEIDGTDFKECFYEVSNEQPEPTKVWES